MAMDDDKDDCRFDSIVMHNSDQHGHGENKVSSSNNNNNFSVIQSRRYQSTSSNAPCFGSFCPSMDLIALGTRSGGGNSTSGGNSNNNTLRREYYLDSYAESIVVHRILSWQCLQKIDIRQLTSIPPGYSDDSTNNHDPDLKDNDAFCTEDIERRCVKAIIASAAEIHDANEEQKHINGEGGNDSHPSSPSPNNNESSATYAVLRTEEEVKNSHGATRVIWSPDGRYMAIGLVDGGVMIHSVEPNTAVGSGSGRLTGPGGVGEESEENNSHPWGMHFIRPPLTSSSDHPLGLNQKHHHNIHDQSKNDICPLVFSPRLTRSMAEKRDSTKQHIIASVASPSSINLPVTTRETLTDAGARILGMTWSQLLPRHHSHSSPSYNDKETCEDGDPCHDSLEIAENYAEDDMDIKESWRHTSEMIHKGIGHFLPGKQDEQPGRGGSQAQFNILCVATTHDIHWYLQGQYRILSMPHDFPRLFKKTSSSISHGDDYGSNGKSCGSGIDMVCSPDLSTLLAVRTPQRQSEISASTPLNMSTAKIFHTTFLPRQRFELQFLAASYRSVFSHLLDVKKSIAAVSISWKSALRPLDLKFSGLVKLLSDYGINRHSTHGVANMDGDSCCGSDSIRLEFLRFILSGRSSASGGGDSTSGDSAAAALDQFFTRPQMHDMLLQKEFRGVEVSLASTEVMLRSRLLQSIRAVVYDADELYGMACAWEKQEIHSPRRDLINVGTALYFYKASRLLYLSFNKCLDYIVEARTRVRDLLAWIRETAARVRAWGTAADSIQRKNARALRISNGVVQSVAAFLSSPMLFAIDDGRHEVEYRTLTECIIGIPLSDFFAHGKMHLMSAVSECAAKQNGSSHNTGNLHNIGSIVQFMFRISTILFDQPRRAFAESLRAIDVCFERHHDLVAIHSRRGAGYFNNGDKSYHFHPKVDELDSSIENCPFWLILARLLGRKIEIIVIPGYTEFVSDGTKRFFLRANLMLPEDCAVTNIAFYSDDGYSSLSPNLNENNIAKEGRQAISLTVRWTNTAMQDFREELWIIPYDDFYFKKCSFGVGAKHECTVKCTNDEENDVVPMIVVDQITMDACGAICPRRRIISTSTPQTPIMKLSLCGSRGTGGVITFEPSTTLNILDLEEDDASCESDGE